MSRGVDGVKGVQSVNRGVNGVEGIQTEPWRGWCGGVKTLPVNRGEGNGSDSTSSSQSWWELH